VDNEDLEKYTVTLPNILSFFTGADEVPPLGFPHQPTLSFSSSNPYPTASTCAIQLYQPNTSLIQLSGRLLHMLLNHGGFALC
jgi:hypothetical protein